MKFISGDDFKNKCDYILDEKGFRCINDNKNNPIYFVKTDYIDNFFQSEFLPKYNFRLVTHNSDFSVNSNYKYYLDYKQLVSWHAQNVDYEHEKLIPIPIGIANEQWPHGNKSIIKSVIDKKYSKLDIIYANFNTNTNYKQRSYCLQFVDPQFIEHNVSFEQYLSKIAQASFNICPMGNGIDSHRIWESLYLKSIPIVESSYNIRYLTSKYDLPIIIIDDWRELPSLSLNTTIYNSLIKGFDPEILTVEHFIQ